MDGTTCLAIAVSDHCVVVANAGDSRAVMGVVRPGTVEGGTTSLVLSQTVQQDCCVEAERTAVFAHLKVKVSL